VAYYPGCSLHSTSKEFNVSAQAVCEALDLTLIEPRGWMCCGSSAAHRVDPEAALRLPLENLAIIEQSGFDEVTMPCAACFNRHKAAQFEIRHDADRKSAMDQEIGYAYQDSVRVSSLVEAIFRRVGPEQVSARVKRPLKGLRVVCYYGCLLTRPPQFTEAANPENPTEMDHLMEALGAEVLDWSYKTSCCGAAHSLTRPDIVLNLSSHLIGHAREAGADLIAVACPLCHTNLDARQFQMKLAEPMPVLYFTQLMVLALGLPERSAALKKNLVDPYPLLRSKGFVTA
jgi:heterodisulfide reductase subunit B